MVVNPIYSSDPTKESVELNSRKLNIAENPQYGTTTEVTYEMINDLPTKPRGNTEVILHDNSIMPFFFSCSWSYI